MKRLLVLAAILFAFASAAPAQAPQATFQDELLDHLQGHWVLTGTIAGKATTHDVDAQWVLNHQYLCFKETSREKNTQGLPAYDAAVYFGWDKPSERYFAIWLDVWGGFGKATVGYAARSGDTMHYRFNDGHSDFHNVIAYDRKTDTWTIAMDNEVNGQLKPFARVTLTRK